MTAKDEDFNQIKSDLVNEIRGMRSDMNRYFEMTDTHERALYGDKIKEPGITEDVRNLKRLAGYVVASITGTLGLLGEFMFRTFFHHPKI